MRAVYLSLLERIRAFLAIKNKTRFVGNRYKLSLDHKIKI